jgi:hypothetical protein
MQPHNPIHPVLSEQQAREILRRQGQDQPIGLEARADPTHLGKELAQLRALIRQYGKKRATVPMVVTGKMAEAMLFLRRKKNRRIYRPWVEKLKVILLADRFHGDIARAIFDWDGDLRDAQHRLTAIKETGVKVQMDVTLGVDPDSFPAMDTGLRRSAAQFLDLDGIKYAGSIAAVARFQYRIDNNGALPDDELVYRLGRELADDVMRRALVAASKLRSKKKVILSSAALAYRLIASEAKRALSVDEFWDRLVKGDELKTSSPVYKLREHFDKERDIKGRKIHQYLTQAQHAAWIIRAWNSWSAGQTAMDFKWPDPNGLPPVK